MTERLRWHTVDYLERGSDRGALLSRGFWLHHVPRLMPLCRLRGHRPVVDGVGQTGERGLVSRWVVCDRCGVRPEPQGRLDPDARIGEPYRGLYRTDWPAADQDRFDEIKGSHQPGPWPTRPDGTIGGQLVIGGRHSFGAEVKIGNPGSEQVLAAQLTLGRLGALYLHTESHGRWLQRRLNATGYESRIIGVSVHARKAFWKLWAKRNSSDPRWQQGAFRVDPRDILLGEPRYSYENVGEPVMGTVRMPHGDDHPVLLQLRRQTLARRHGRHRQSWTVDWDSPGGIPTKPGNRGRVTGSGVSVTQASVTEGAWPQVAAAAIAHRLSESRARYGWRVTEDAA